MKKMISLVLHNVRNLFLWDPKRRGTSRPMKRKWMFLGVVALIMAAAGAVYFWPVGKEPVSGPLGELPVFMDFMVPT